MQWNNFLCASPPQLRELNHSNSAFKKLMPESPKSTNKVNLNTDSRSHKKKRYDLTSNKKMDLEDSISILFAK